MLEDVRQRERRSRAAARLRELWDTWWPSLALLPLCIYFSVSRDDYTFMDAIDLAVHEVGHLVFAMFGEFIRMAGGTLLQLLLPAAIAFVYLRRGHVVGTQLGMLWLGQSFLNVSVYAADARAQAMPLVGGPFVLHDWHYLLGKTGLLAFDAEIALFFVIIAHVLFVALLTVPRWAI